MNQNNKNPVPCTPGKCRHTHYHVTLVHCHVIPLLTCRHVTLLHCHVSSPTYMASRDTRTLSRETSTLSRVTYYLHGVT